MTMFFEIIIMQ